MRLIIAGLILGVVILATINTTDVMGYSCHHVGRFTMNSLCINSGVYNGALGLAGALIVLGLALLIKNSTAARP